MIFLILTSRTRWLPPQRDGINSDIGSNKQIMISTAVDEARGDRENEQKG